MAAGKKSQPPCLTPSKSHICRNERNLSYHDAAVSSPMGMTDSLVTVASKSSFDGGAAAGIINSESPFSNAPSVHKRDEGIFSFSFF